MIRIATQEDIPRIVELGSRSLQDGPYAGVIRDVPAQAEYCAHEVMDKGRILLGEEDGKVMGLIGFIVANHHFSGQRYAAELMWYVEQEHRRTGLGLKLLWEAKKQAKEMGAEGFVMTAPNDAVASIYQRCGGEKLETSYWMEL